MRRVKISREGNLIRLRFPDPADGRIGVEVYQVAYKLQELALLERDQGREARARRLEELSSVVGGSALELIWLD